jgi:hypothetical protein
MPIQGNPCSCPYSCEFKKMNKSPRWPDLSRESTKMQVAAIRDMTLRQGTSHLHVQLPSANYIRKRTLFRSGVPRLKWPVFHAPRLRIDHRTSSSSLVYPPSFSWQPTIETISTYIQNVTAQRTLNTQEKEDRNPQINMCIIIELTFTCGHKRYIPQPRHRNPGLGLSGG